MVIFFTPKPPTSWYPICCFSYHDKIPQPKVTTGRKSKRDVAAGRLAISLHLNHKHESERVNSEWDKNSKCIRSIPVTYFLHNHTPNQFHWLGTKSLKFKYLSLQVLIQTTTSYHMFLKLYGVVKCLEFSRMFIHQKSVKGIHSANWALGIDQSLCPWGLIDHHYHS